MKLFDAHCHLQDKRIIDRTSEIISAALAVGVSNFAVNGTSEKDWELVKEMGELYPSVVPCFGIHPWYGSMILNFNAKSFRSNVNSFSFLCFQVYCR